MKVGEGVGLLAPSSHPHASVPSAPLIARYATLVSPLGYSLDTRWNWKNTIAPAEQRAGHYNSAWGYWV